MWHQKIARTERRCLVCRHLRIHGDFQVWRRQLSRVLKDPGTCPLVTACSWSRQLPGVPQCGLPASWLMWCRIRSWKWTECRVMSLTSGRFRERMKKRTKRTHVMGVRWRLQLDVLSGSVADLTSPGTTSTTLDELEFKGRCAVILFERQCRYVNCDYRVVNLYEHWTTFFFTIDYYKFYFHRCFLWTGLDSNSISYCMHASQSAGFKTDSQRGTKVHIKL